MVEELSLKLQKLMEEKGYSEVENICNKITDENQTDTEAYLQRGIARYYLETFRLAISDFDEVLSRDNQNKQAHYYRAEAIYAKPEIANDLENVEKKYREALSGYEKALSFGFIRDNVEQKMAFIETKLASIISYKIAAQTFLNVTSTLTTGWKNYLWKKEDTGNWERAISQVLQDNKLFRVNINHSQKKLNYLSEKISRAQRFANMITEKRYEEYSKIHLLIKELINNIVEEWAVELESSLFSSSEGVRQQRDEIKKASFESDKEKLESKIDAVPLDQPRGVSSHIDSTSLVLNETLSQQAITESRFQLQNSAISNSDGSIQPTHEAEINLSNLYLSKKQIFCEKLKEIFNETYTVCYAITTNQVEYPSNNIVQTVTNQGPLLVYLLGPLGLTIQAIAGAAKFITNVQEREFAECIKQLAVSSVEMDKLITDVAHVLANSYEAQLEQMTLKGLYEFANCIAIRMIQYVGSDDGKKSSIVNRAYNTSKANLKSALDRVLRHINPSLSRLTEQTQTYEDNKIRLILGVSLGISKSENEYGTPLNIVTEDKNFKHGYWYAEGVIDMTGIITTENRYLINADSNHEKYGFRKASQKEANALGYDRQIILSEYPFRFKFTKQQSIQFNESFQTGYQPLFHSQKKPCNRYISDPLSEEMKNEIKTIKNGLKENEEQLTVLRQILRQ